ncbi:unnamed protein product, partial [Closterium sp. NIES-53]
AGVAAAAAGEGRGGATGAAAGAGAAVGDARGGGAAATASARPARPSTCMLEPRRSRYCADGPFHLVLRSCVPPPPVLPQPPELSLTVLHDPLSDYLRASRPVVSRVLSALVTHPTAPPVSALVTTVAGFASSHRLDYAAHLVSGPSRSPSSGGAPVFPLEVLEDRQFEFGFLAATVPHLCAMLLAPEGDPDALDLPIPHTHAEAFLRPWASYSIASEKAEMASYRSTGTYVNAVPPPGTNAISGRWLYKVNRPPRSPPVFKACNVARGFSQREGVDFFLNFAPTPKMTTLWVLLHIAAQRDYELHSLDFSTAFLQRSLHEQIWLRRLPDFTGSFPPGTQWQLRRPVYNLRQAPCKWHDTLRSTLAVLDFFPSSADPSLFILMRFHFPFSNVHLTPLAVDHGLTAPPSDKSFESTGPYHELVVCLIENTLSLVCNFPNPSPSSPTSPLVPRRLSHPPRHHLSLSPSRSPLPTIPPSSLPLTRHRLSVQSRCRLFLSPRGRLPPIPPTPLPLIRRRISLLPAIASPSHPDVATPVVASSSHPVLASPSHPVVASPSHPAVSSLPIPPSPLLSPPSPPPPPISPSPLTTAARARAGGRARVGILGTDILRLAPRVSSTAMLHSPFPPLAAGRPPAAVAAVSALPADTRMLPSALHAVPRQFPISDVGSFASHRVPFPCSALNGSMLPPLVASLSSASASTSALHPPAPHESALQHAPLSACMPSTCHQPFCQPRFHATRHTRHCAAAGAGGSGGQQQVSVTDGELQERGIAVHWDTALLDYAKLDDLFHRAGFPRRGPKKLQHALSHSTLVLWFSAPQPSPAEPLAFFSSPTSPSPSPPEAAVEPVAFARTAGDGVFNEVVWDVAVDPRLQGSGLGRALMERVVGALLRLGVCNVGLFAEQRVVTFYRPLGFAMDPDGIRCMAHRSQEKKGKR